MLRLHKHNRETYERLTQLFACNDRVAVVQPTGTGKSFIILKLISDNKGKNILILSPSVYIFKQIQTHAENSKISLDGVQFITYTKLAMYTKAEISGLKCDYIILDEFHRCGAAEWGRGIERLLSLKSNAKVLGTSATPIRYLDSSRNMAEELFNSVYAVNMSLHEATAHDPTEQQAEIIEYIKQHGSINDIGIQNLLGVKKTRAYIIAKKMLDAQMIVKQGKGINKIYMLP